jgi:RNA polymerase sigma-70 factor (ECF subfamily)
VDEVAGDLDGLVLAARAGGSWAFGRLWEMLSPAVAAYVRNRGARDPDDVTSEVFLAAFTGLAGFEGDGRAFRSWLFTIAHHKAVDSLRRGPGRRELPVDVLDDGRSAPSAESGALEHLADEDVRAMLATLSPDQRDVLLLRLVADLELAEVARVVGKPVGAVKALQHRGLARLRKELGRPVSDDGPEAIAQLR